MANPAPENVEAKVEELQVNGVAHQEEEEDDDKVTPWEVTTTKATGIDYDKLIGKGETIRWGEERSSDNAEIHVADFSAANQR